MGKCSMYDTEFLHALKVVMLPIQCACQVGLLHEHVNHCYSCILC